MTALLASVEPRTVARWVAGEVVPREEAEKKLRSAYQIFHLLEQVEASSTVRAWFMGMNEQLADLSPAEAIADGNARDVSWSQAVIATPCYPPLNRQGLRQGR